MNSLVSTSFLQIPFYCSCRSPETGFKSGHCFHPIVLEMRIMALPKVQTHLSALFCATQDISANFLNLLLENSLVALRLGPPPSPHTVGEGMVAEVPGAISLLSQGLRGNNGRWIAECYTIVDNCLCLDMVLWSLSPSNLISDFSWNCWPGSIAINSLRQLIIFQSLQSRERWPQIILRGPCYVGLPGLMLVYSTFISMFDEQS